MYKEIVVDKEARVKVLEGINVIADSVKITLGPMGRNVGIDDGSDEPEVTNDGVSVAEAIKVKDPVINFGVKRSKSVAKKVNSLVGDSTSTAVTLHQAIYSKGLSYIDSDVNVIALRKGILSVTSDIEVELGKMAKKIKTDKEIYEVAVTSVESHEIAQTLVDVVKKVGKDGAITVEESFQTGITHDVVEGMQFGEGYMFPFMINKRAKKEAEFENVEILVTDQKISDMEDLLPIVEKVKIAGRNNLVIICEGLEGEAMGMSFLNTQRGIFNTLAIKAPGYGSKKKEVLEDIAIMTGGTFITSDTVKLKEITLDDLGRAKKVVSKKDSTTIIGGAGSKKAVKNRISELKTAIKEAKPYEVESFQQRIGKLSTGVGVVRVGANTEAEMLYLKKKIEDGINAVKSALEEGILPGGGVALMQVAKTLSISPFGKKPREYNLAIQIMKDACLEPMRLIAKNSGLGDGSGIVIVVQDKPKNFGYNPNTDSFEDMFKAGVVDSAKAMKTALRVAAGDAAILLTVGRLMVQINETQQRYDH